MKQHLRLIGVFAVLLVLAVSTATIGLGEPSAGVLNKNAQTIQALKRPVSAEHDNTAPDHQKTDTSKVAKAFKKRAVKQELHDAFQTLKTITSYQEAEQAQGTNTFNALVIDEQKNNALLVTADADNLVFTGVHYQKDPATGKLAPSGKTAYGVWSDTTWVGFFDNSPYPFFGFHKAGNAAANKPNRWWIYVPDGPSKGQKSYGRYYILP